MISTSVPNLETTSSKNEARQQKTSTPVKNITDDFQSIYYHSFVK